MPFREEKDPRMGGARTSFESSGWCSSLSTRCCKNPKTIIRALCPAHKHSSPFPATEFCLHTHRLRRSLQRMEQTLFPVAYLLEHAYRVLYREGPLPRAHRARLLPEKCRDDALLGENAYSILHGFGVARFADGHYALSIPTRPHSEYRAAKARLQKRVRQKMKALQLLYYQITSRGYFSAEATNSRSEVEALFLEYGIPLELYEPFAHALEWLAVVERVVGRRGGIKLVAEGRSAAASATPPPAQALGRGNTVTLRLVGKDPAPKKAQHEFQYPLRHGTGKDDEYKLYPALWEFFSQTRTSAPIDGEDFEWQGWRVTTVNQGGDPRAEMADLPSSGRIFRSVRGSDKWRNPDLVGYRFEGAGVLGVPELEILTVEAKRKGEFNRQNILEASAHLYFANICYLAIEEKYNDIRHKKSLLNDLTKRGIGLVTLTGNATPGKIWEESIPPRYNTARRRNAGTILAAYFDKDLAAIRAESLSAMGIELEPGRGRDAG